MIRFNLVRGFVGGSAASLFVACGGDGTAAGSGGSASIGGDSSANVGGHNSGGQSSGGESFVGGGNGSGSQGHSGGRTNGGGSASGTGGTGGLENETSGGANASGGGLNAAGGTTSAPPCEPIAGGNPNRVCIKGKEHYLNGINVAWDQWTADLTDYNANTFEKMFSTLEASGANAVRWWWFIDGENQLTFNGHLAQPLPQAVFDNLDAAFDAAAKHGIFIMPSLLSFDIHGQGREWLVTDEAATTALVENVIAPLVERYNDHPAFGLWEIMNEGDWLLADEGGSVSVADYQRFHGMVAAGIHGADDDALVTTGSASFKYLEDGNNIVSDEALRSATGGNPLAHLDVYQTHYYGWMHGDGWSYEPWIKTSTEWQNDGKPILIGEFSCIGEEGRWSSLEMHENSVDQGFAGTFCWAYFDNRADDEGDWSDAKPGVEAIAKKISAGN